MWYDACTGKHVRYGVAIARRLRKAGHEVVLTAREHPDALALAHVLGEDPIVVGKYDPTSLFTRLRESANRMLEFSKLFKDDLPDVAVSHQSVELCRTAFGLGIPVVLTADTPHATAVNKLTIPLATTLVVSEAIPRRLFRNYGARDIVQFEGVDEVAWVKDFKPLGSYEFKKPLIVVRQLETQASYALGTEDVTMRLAQRLCSLGNVVFLSRYAKARKGSFVVVNDFVDGASLAAQADLVVGVGGTLSREAALQGIPSIAISDISRTYVNKYLAKKGFPLFLVNPSKVLTCARKYLGKRFDVTERLLELENPVDIVENVVTRK